MSLERMERYIKEMEALRNYDRFKKERDQLFQEKFQLKNSLEKVGQERNRLEQELQEKDKELNHLRETEKSKDERLKKNADAIKNLRSRVKTLEDLKAIVDGKTLSEAECAFLKTKEEEVKRRADEAFNSRRDKWERKEKPNAVFNEAIKELTDILDVLSRPGPQYFRKELVDAGVPLKVKEIISSQVNKRLDIEWPKWFETNIETRAEAIKDEIKQNALKLLKDYWEVKCDECGCVQTYEFTSQDLATLLRNGYTTRECANPNCNNQFGRHEIRMDLKLLIAQKLKYSS